jgi:amidase
VDVALPQSFDALMEARTVINPVERARAMAHEWNTNRSLISEGLTRQIEEGLSISHERYVTSLQRIKQCRDRVPDVFEDADVLLVPCVTGEAPQGLSFTGDTRFQEFWTALHTPTITLPTHKGPNGLPIGIQLVGRLYDDANLLATARWAAERLLH